MAKLIGLSYRKDGTDYELNLDWDEEAFVNEKVTFAVAARKKSQDESDWLEWNVSVSLEDDPELGPAIQIEAGDFKESFPLKGLLEETQLIDLLPAHVFAGGDPICGCLIRSGISATVGQLIDCRNETAGMEWFNPRAKAVYHCVRGNVPSMAGKMALRATVCIARGGF